MKLQFSYFLNGVKLTLVFATFSAFKLFQQKKYLKNNVFEKFVNKNAIKHDFL